ncbi:MAG: MFS transporter [Bradyrhizobium sp.]
MVDIAAAPSQQRRADASWRTLVLVSTAHCVSHFYILVLPMLFPFLKAQLGVSYFALGVALTVFGVVSLTQAPMGYVVDHLGARKILLIGLSLGGLALILLGLHLSYPALIASAVLLGLANSVYHPCDYAILSAHMDAKRMGRAYSVHTFAGFLGGAVAPAVVAALVATVGGRGALVVSGAVAPLVALLLMVFGIPDTAPHHQPGSGVKPARQSIVTPALIVLTMFFMLYGLSNAGIANFGVVALMTGYGASYSIANLSLTAYLAATAVGVLAGGFLADRTERHGKVAAICFAIDAVVVLLIATVSLPSLLLALTMIAAGLLAGAIAPSRDMLVRSAAPAGAAGRAFGIVSTGFNFSGILGPLLFGWIMDRHLPHWVFGVTVVFMVLTALLAPFTGGKRKAS